MTIGEFGVEGKGILKVSRRNILGQEVWYKSILDVRYFSRHLEAI